MNSNRIAIISQNGQPKALIGRALLQHATRLVLGYIVVEMNVQNIMNILSNTELGNAGQFFIMNRSGELLLPYSLENLNVAEDIFNEMVAHDAPAELHKLEDGNIAIWSGMQSAGWYVAGYAPYRELMAEFYIVIQWIAIFIVGTLICAILSYMYITKRMTYPIQQLKKHMLAAAEGNLDAEIAVLSHNEFNVLEKQYILTESCEFSEA